MKLKNILLISTLAFAPLAYSNIFDADKETVDKAHAGDAEAQWNYGFSLMVNGKQDEADQWIKKAAEQGHEKASQHIKLQFLSDFNNQLNSKPGTDSFARAEAAARNGQAKDAFSLYQKAARKGHVAAQFKLAAAYQEGQGTEKI